MVDEFSDHARPEGNNKILAPYKVIALGLLSSRAVKLGAIVCFGVATIIGLYLVSVTGWPLLVVCLAGAAVAYFYSAGARPLGSTGLGHLLVFLFMGPVMVLGTYYVQTRTFSQEVLWYSIPIGCTVTAILVANDLRDFEEDRTAGKITPVTLFGRRFGRWEWTTLVTASFLIAIVLTAAKGKSVLNWLFLLASFQTIKTSRIIWHGKLRPELASGLPASSKLHGQFGFLLSVGIALSRLIQP